MKKTVIVNRGIKQNCYISWVALTAGVSRISASGSEACWR